MEMSYHYTNDLGILKRISIGALNPITNKYPVTLWELAHGELCGSGEMTKEEINEFLAHYGITETF